MDDRLRQLEQVFRESGPYTMRQLRETALKVELEKCDGHKPTAADRIGIALKSVYNWIREFGWK